MKRPKQADNLVKLGLLHDEGHLAVAKSENFDPTVRYLNAYDAAFQVATAGLRALDLRPSQKAGSRAQTVQSLAWTLDVGVSLMPVLIQANQARGELAYSKSEHATPGRHELAALIGAAQAILD